MTGRPEPSRITVALDMAGLFGPEADATLGVAEPTIDLWETGAMVPTEAQLADIAARAGITVEWFYGDPIEPQTFQMCYRTRKAAGGGSRCKRVVYPVLPERPEGTLF